MYHHHHAECDCTSVSGSDKVPILWTVLVLLSGFSIVEFVVSYSSHSLALLADVGHMLADGFAIALALFATWLGQLPASNQATFGYRRVEILAALLNSLGLVAISIWIGWEAVQSLQAPPENIASMPMLITALIGLGVNSLNAVLLHRQSSHDLNLKGAFLHVVADAVSSVGVILAAIAIEGLHWFWADGLISLLVAGLILAGALPLTAQSLQILLEKPSSPEKVAQVRSYLASIETVVEVSHLRLWTVALGQEILCAHLSVTLRDAEARDRLLRQLQTTLQQEFDVQEVILQMTLPFPSKSLSLLQPDLMDLVLETPGSTPNTPLSN